MEIDPVERLVLAGLSKKFAQVFSCPQTIVSSAYEKMRLLSKRKVGEPINYPMAFLKVTGIGAATDRYVSPYMARTGTQTVASDDDNSAIAVKLLPANFQVEIEFRTDQFDLSAESSVLAFSRRWLFARRNGLLKFNVAYGKLSLMIGTILDEQVTVPERASTTEQVPEYLVTAGMQLLGWVGEPQTRTIGTVQNVDLDANFWAFKNTGDQI